MFYILISVVLVLVAAGCFYLYGKMRSDKEDPILLKLGGYVLFGVVILYTLVESVYQIPAGNVAVVYRFGEIVGQIPEGLQFIPPWNKGVLANVQVQSHQFKKLDCFSKETQDVFIAATLNINVSPQTIQNLYRIVGRNWFAVLVEPRVAQIFKDETVKFNSIDIAPARETIRKTVRERLERELTSYSIDVKDLLLDNVDFSPAFKAAIEKKQVATQKALEEEQNVRVKKQLAEQAIEVAKGQAQSILINAEKQAEANRKLSASLTPELIQYTMIMKLSDKIEVMILPSGQSFILSPEMLKPKTAAK